MEEANQQHPGSPLLVLLHRVLLAATADAAGNCCRWCMLMAQQNSKNNLRVASS
jgi:hypothetical protein